MTKRKTVLVLWNQVDDDVYEKFQHEGPKPLAWDPDRTASEVGTVQQEMDALLSALREGLYEVVCM